MSITVTDASSGLYNWLKTHADATSLRTLVYNGATNILESGDLVPKDLDTDFLARVAASEITKVLAVTVHDDGEQGDWVHVSVRIFDRNRGYRNIRAFRDLFLSVWEESDEKGVITLVDVNSKSRGLLTLEYAGRSGHVFEPRFQTDGEVIALSGRIVREDW